MLPKKELAVIIYFKPIIYFKQIIDSNNSNIISSQLQTQLNIYEKSLDMVIMNFNYDSWFCSWI